MLFIEKIKDKLLSPFRNDFVRYNNIIIPTNRFRLCGPEFGDNQYYLESAEKEAVRLINSCGLTVESSVLDVGCGAGRLPIGIISHLGEIKAYWGVDVGFKSIQWCKRCISKEHPSFQFVHINFKNLRYNPRGKKIDNRFQFPFSDQEFDIIYLYSVFSHMVADDVKMYLKEFNRLLNVDGKVFLTGFFEEDVPEMTVNPKGYRMQWNRALHCVRYNKVFFDELLNKYGFFIDRFDYEGETDGQSGVYISKKKDVSK